MRMKMTIRRGLPLLLLPLRANQSLMIGNMFRVWSYDLPLVVRAMNPHAA